MLRAGRGVSIERRLPLLTSSLLLVVIVTLAGSAFTEVRRLAIAAARARLESVSTQFASSNAEGYRKRIAALAAMGRNDTLVRFVQTHDRALAAAARASRRPATPPASSARC